MRGKKRKKRAPSAGPGPGPHDRRGEDNSRAAGADEEARIDETLAQSFPASDPPGWTLGDERLVKPDRRRK